MKGISQFVILFYVRMKHRTKDKMVFIPDINVFSLKSDINFCEELKTRCDLEAKILNTLYYHF